MVSLNLNVNLKGYCTKCSRRKDKNHYENAGLLPIWYNSNKKPMYTVPFVLKRLSHAERMLIQRVSPFVPLHHIKKGTWGISGHVCAFEQDIEGFVSILPRKSSDTSVMKVMQQIKSEIGNGSATRIKAFRV